MRGRVVVGLVALLAACGQTASDSSGDASAGGAAGKSGGTGGTHSGGGGKPSFGGVAGGAGIAGIGALGGVAGTDAGGGSGGTHACSDSKECAANEYCTVAYLAYPGCFSGGTCEPRPTSCPGECTGACTCGGEWCSVCISQMFGHDATPFGSQCMSDGGAPNTLDAGLGGPCGYYWGQCGPGLKCCYACKVGGCQGSCIPPDANGMCPTVIPG